jgi:phosphate-selective porin OprO/OprP
VQGLGLGVAATLGSNEGAVAATGLPSYKSPGNQTIFSYLSDGKTLDNTVVAGGRRYRYSPQAYYYAGRFGLMAEYVVSSQEVALGVSSDTLAHRAWQATASLLLTDDRASYKGVDPKRAFDPGAGAWGAFEVAARYDRLDLDDGAFPVFADPGRSVRRATEWAAGVNWYLTRGVKFVLDYSRTSFEGGDPAGDREDEKIIFTRFQIGF